MKEKKYLVKIAENIVGIKTTIEVGGTTVETTTIAHMPYKRACKQLSHIITKSKAGNPDYGFSPRRSKTVETQKDIIIYPDKTEREVVLTYYPMNITGVYLVEEYDILSHQRVFNIEECSRYGNRCHLCC